MMDELEINFKTISSKLDGIPKIIYLNDNQHLDKKMYMENQFKSWGIKDYKRHCENVFIGKHNECDCCMCRGVDINEATY